MWLLTVMYILTKGASFLFMREREIRLAFTCSSVGGVCESVVCIRVCVCVRQTTRRERDREAEREKECARAAPDWMESSMFVLELLAAYLDHMCSEFGSNRPNERHIVPQNCSVCTCAHGKQPARAERERKKQTWSDKTPDGNQCH